MSPPSFIPLFHIRESVTSQINIYSERFIHHGHLRKVKLYQVLLKNPLLHLPVNHWSQPCIQKHSNVGPSQLDERT